MTQMRTYIDLYAQRFDDARYEWGGTSHRNILLKSGESVGTYIGVSDYETYVSDTDSLQINQLFVLPTPIDFVSVIDGTISGSIVVQIRSDAQDSTYLTRVEIDVVKIDSSGVETVILSTLVFDGMESVSDYDTTKTLGYMYWGNVHDAIISSDEKIGVRAKTYGYATGHIGGYDMVHRLILTKNSTDLSISIPTL